MKYIIFIISIFSLISIRIAYADVVIHEISWVGYEWIELYNTGDEEVSLENWRIARNSFDLNLIKTLTGSIAAGEYLVLCSNPRSGQEVITNCTQEGISFGSGLTDAGVMIALVSPEQSGDDVSWITVPKGTNKSLSYQKTSNGNWITAEATPGSENKQSSSGGSSGGGSGGGGNASDDELDSSEDKFDKEDEIIEVVKDPVYSARMVLPHVFMQYVPVELTTLVTKDKTKTELRGKFEWSMGDGGYVLQERSVPFKYTYQEPGEYTISLRYYSSIFNKDPDTIHRKVITVLPAQVQMIHTETGTLRITNNTSGTLDIGEWKLWRAGKTVTIPKHTLVSAGKTVSLPYHVHNFDPLSGEVFLLTPTDVIVTGTQQGVQNIQTKKTNTSTPYEKISELFTEQKTENLYQGAGEVLEIQNENKKPKNPWIIYSLIGLIAFTLGFGVFSYREELQEKNEKL